MTSGITVADMLVLIDTLRGSLGVQDNGYLFVHGRKTRENLLAKLWGMANEQELQGLKSDIASTRINGS